MVRFDDCHGYRDLPVNKQKEKPDMLQRFPWVGFTYTQHDMTRIPPMPMVPDRKPTIQASAAPYAKTLELYWTSATRA